MRALLIVVIIMIFAVAAALMLSSPTAKVTDEMRVIKIGAILALTGDYSIFGTSLQHGIEIALDELNKQSDVKYKIIYEDDGDVDVKKSVESARKLIDVDKIDVGMITAVNDGKSVSPVFEAGKMPLLVLFDANKEIEKGDYTFGIGFSTEGAAASMSAFAYTNLNISRVSVIYTYDDWSILIASEFKKAFESSGGKVILFEGTGFDENDFRTVILKSKDADAIYAPLVFPSHLLKQAKEFGYKGYLLSADGLNQDQIDAAGNAAEGVYYTDVFVPESDKINELAEKHKVKYGQEPQITALTAIGYDAMYAIDAAVRSKGVGQIKNGLYEIDFGGATGTVDFDESGMSPRFERIFVVKNGKGALIG